MLLILHPSKNPLEIYYFLSMHRAAKPLGASN
jgi:hypothetical protein